MSLLLGLKRFIDTFLILLDFILSFTQKCFDESVDMTNHIINNYYKYE